MRSTESWPGHPDIRVRLLALACTFASLAALPAQDPPVLLRDVEEEFQALQRHADPPAMRTMDRILRRLSGLRYAGSAARARARRFLEAAAARQASVTYLRVRVAAVETLVELGPDAGDLDWLLALARRRDQPAFEGMGFFVERALRALRSPEAVRSLLSRLEKSGDEAVRVCLGALARLDDEDLALLALPFLPVILDLAREAPTEIRERALLLLGRLPDTRALPAIVEGAVSREITLRLAAAEALGGHAERDAARRILEDLAVDPQPRVRETAFASLGRDGAEAVPFLIRRMPLETLRNRAAVADALQRLTGRDLGRSPEAWREWFEATHANGGGLPRPPRGTERPRYARRYYGIPVTSDRLLFILDVSGSMAFKSEGRQACTRLEIARRELEHTLGLLGPATRFNIITFSTSPLPFHREGLVPASRARVRKAVRFLERQGANGGTNTYAALRMAFDRFPEADTIYFLSDGSPTVGAVISQELILYRVHRWNASRRVRIHGIALLTGRAPDIPSAAEDDPEDAWRFMRSLAAMTGGVAVRSP